MVYSGGGTGALIEGKQLSMDIRLGAALALGGYNTKQARDRLDDLIFTLEQLTNGKKYTRVKHKEKSPYTGNDMGQHIFKSSHRINPIYGRTAMFSLGKIGHIDDLPLLDEISRVQPWEWDHTEWISQMRKAGRTTFRVGRINPTIEHLRGTVWKMKQAQQVTPQDYDGRRRRRRVAERTAAVVAMGLAMRKLGQEQKADREVMSSLSDDEHDFPRKNAMIDRQRALNEAMKLLIKHINTPKEPAEFRAAVALAMGISGNIEFVDVLKKVKTSKPAYAEILDDSILIGYVSLALAMLDEHQAAIKGARLLLGKSREEIDPLVVKKRRFKKQMTFEQVLGHRAAVAALGLVEDKKGKALKILYGNYGRNELVSWQVMESLRRRKEYEMAPALIVLLNKREIKASEKKTPARLRVAAAMSLDELLDQDQPSRLQRFVMGNNYTFPRGGRLTPTALLYQYRAYGNPFLYLVLMPMVW